ncbi:MAG: enoyl-CoA hydratase [Planctomycetota bacterium]|nr:MAG: enoyl-CoA hydratase [Planctomycetota bacterium]
MASTESLRIERDGRVAHVVLNRPHVHNAFDAELIGRLTEAFRSLGSEPEVRVIVLRGEGRSFCAGADLHWMRESASWDEADNLADAHRFAAMLQAVDRCPKPVVARVHRLALGGGAGLVCCADIAVAEEGARFAFSEARLGILPAVISPFVLRRIGPGHARALFLSAERFDAARALRIGLVDEVVPAEQLDAAVAAHVGSLLECGPRAQAEIKELVRRVSWRAPEEVAQLTAATIARVRASEEGKEGIRAFLDKREPSWRVRQGG